MNHPRGYIRIFFVLTAFGVIGILAMFTRHNAINIRAVDFLHIFGAGMCIGGAIIALSAHLHNRNSS